jgi:hypothetical protein
MSVDAKIITVVQAIKQSIETAAGPGVSVNAHPNPFFINVNGALDLKHAATLLLQRLEEYEAAVKAKIEKSIKAAETRVLGVGTEVKAEIEAPAKAVQAEEAKVAGEVKAEESKAVAAAGSVKGAL